MDGEGRWARYRIPDALHVAAAKKDADEPAIPLSAAGIVIRDDVSQAPDARKPVGYDRDFLDRYSDHLHRARLAVLLRASQGLS